MIVYKNASYLLHEKKQKSQQETKSYALIAISGKSSRADLVSMSGSTRVISVSPINRSGKKV